MSTSGPLYAGELLSGPRGRRLCLQLAQRADEAVAGAVFHAAYDLDPGAGTSMVMFGPGAGNRPKVSPRDVADAVARATIPSLDGRLLLQALADAVAFARYWQQPDGEDVLAAMAPVRSELGILAAAVAASPHARWWTTALDITSQCRVSWIEDGRPPVPPDQDATSALATWRAETVEDEQKAVRERPTDPDAPFSGVWWSAPPSTLQHTSRNLENLGPVGLVLVEDSLGWQRARVTPVAMQQGARVFEIDGPEEWARLCHRHPLPVTASRRHDWFRTTGRADVTWVQPDWASVATEADAIHLTVAGYLTTAGRAIPIGPGTASVLAGWDPDAAYWLTVPPAAAGPAREWSYDQDADHWMPAH